MTDYKTSRDRLPKHRDDDHIGITFGVFLAVAVGIVAGSLGAIIMHASGLTDAFILSFA